MLKLFISQPMKGKTDEEILQERNRIISMAQAQYGSVEVIDSFIKENAPKDVNVSLWYLSKSIEFLSMADAGGMPEDVRLSMTVRKPTVFRLSKRRTELCVT